MDEFFRRLRERKLVQWALAYVAAAFALIQVLDVIGQQFGWPEAARRGITLALGVGFPVTLVLAWYHGERGAQRASGTELLIVALLLVLGGGLLWRLAPRPPGVVAHAPVAPPPAANLSIDRKSIAVLPFASMSAEKDNTYFADGMRDMILTRLAAIGDLKVISRTSTDRYGVHPEDIRTVALQLGVASVLEGSVQKAGNQVLINLQLIDAGSDTHLWAQAYTRAIDDIFGVEGEIAQTVAEALHAKLSDAEQKVIADRPTSDAQAFDLFLRAEQVRHAAATAQSAEGLDRAIALYRQAVARDPKFALAWAELAYSQAQLYWFGGTDTATMQDLAEATAADARRALDLQPTLAEASLAMGFFQYYVRLDFAAALAAFEKSLRAKPNDSDALLAMGLITRRLSRFDEAIRHFTAANRIDPRNQGIAATLTTTLVLARHYSQAAAVTARELALDPGNTDAVANAALQKLILHDDLAGAEAALHGDDPQIRLIRAELLHAQRKFDAAIAIVEEIPDTPENFYSGRVDTKSRILGTLYLDSGRADIARPLLLDAREKIVLANAKVPDDHPAAAETRLELALVDASLGDTASALELTRRALELPATRPEKNYLGWVDVAGLATRVYARARRADLAVPLLQKLLDSPGTGWQVSHAGLRLDPDFAPIRDDPAFQALIRAHPGSGDIAG